MYGRTGILGAGIVVLIGIVIGIGGLARLLRQRRFGMFASYVAAIAAFPLMFNLIMRIEDRHSRLWLGIPLAVIVPVWLLSGYFVGRSANRIAETEVVKPAARPDDHDRRVKGLGLVALGACAWLYGFVNRDLTSREQAVVFAVWAYSMLHGLLWLLTGGRMSDLDQS